MRGLAKSVLCDGCEIALTDYNGRMMDRGPICSSIVYGVSSSVTLCQKCSQYEIEEEERQGTNDLPKIRKHYENSGY